MGKLRNNAQSLEELKHQFGAVDDEKLRLTLTALANKYSDHVRFLIYKAYNDPELHAIYRGIRRASKLSDMWSGSNTKARRQVTKYPNGDVWDFVNTVMTSLYGENWMRDKQTYRKALRHELVRPWWVVNKL